MPAGENRSAGAVLSDLTREALTAQHTAAAADDFFGFEPLPHVVQRSRMP